MEIFNHPSCTKVLGAPADMPEPDCSPLPITEHVDKFGTWSVSFWKPDADEIKALQDGGTIALWVKAQDDEHPVVGVSVAKPVE